MTVPSEPGHVGLLADRPAPVASLKERLYWATDSGLYQCNGVAWRLLLNAAVVPTSPVAFTQTYATTATTVVAPTAATVATADGSDAGTTQTLANALKVAVNALVADSLLNRKLINSVIDGQQGGGIAT